MIPKTDKRTVKLLMWEITSSLADRWFALSNLFLILGAAMVLVGTIGAILLSGVREQFSNARISENETKTAQAIAESDLAKKGAAEANARALEAQLALEKFKAPRTLTIEQQDAISEKLRQFTGTRFDAAIIRSDPETYRLLDMIETPLTAAGWTQVDWRNNDAVLKRTGKPDVGEWAATNVIIAVPHDLIPQLWMAAVALAAALTAADIPAQAQDAQGMTVKNNDALHLLVGRKM